jgi:subtilisin family serine protease
MASPVVAGIAALLLEYFPTLSARQLKQVIEQSSVPLKDSVRHPGTGEKVLLSDLSRTGGIVNAYEAVKLAATIKGERKPPVTTSKPQTKPAAAPVKKTKGF